MVSQLQDLVGLTLEGLVGSDGQVTLKALGEAVELAEGHPTLPASSSGAAVGVNIQLSANKTKVVGRVAELPPKRATTGRKLVLAAVLTKLVHLPLKRQQPTPLGSAPYTLYQIPEASFDIFMRTTANGAKKVDMPLKGYKVAPVRMEDGRQVGIVDLKTTEVTYDGRDIVGANLRAGIVSDDGEPGALLSVDAKVLDALPLRADVYIVPDDNHRLYFGDVDRDQDEITVYGSLLIANVAKKIEHAMKTGARLQLDACSAQHDSFLAGVMCERVVLKEVAGGRWEVLNDPLLISQLCFFQNLSTGMSRLDRGEHPSVGTFVNLSASASPVPPSNAKRQKTESPPPAAARSRTPPPPTQRKVPAAAAFKPVP